MNKKTLKRKIKFIVDPIRKMKANQRYRRVSQYAKYYEGSSIVKNTILYESRDGNSMTDSPYAMFNYMLNNPEYKNYQHIWSIEDFAALEQVISKYRDLPNVKFVKRNSAKYLKYLSSCEYLINNSTFQSFFTPKEDQIYINTWHGTPLKLMGFDIPGNPSHSQNVLRNFLSTSYLLSPNPHTTRIFKDSYKLQDIYEGTIIEEGYPRIDMTLNTDSSEYRIFLQNLGLSLDEKKQTILYAPTWKGTSVSKAKDDTQQIVSDLKYLQERIGDRYNLLVKVHPFLFKLASQTPELKKMLVPDFVDTNELLSTVDLLVTDYSSIFFDYLVTNKPIIFYTWDADIYAEERGQYISNEELPGPIVYNADELAEVITNIKDIQKRYEGNYQECRKAYACYEDGRVTERIVNSIFGKSTVPLNIHHCISNDKEKILIYPGGMKNNGITSSFINLMSNIDYSKYDVSCFLATPHDREVLNNLSKVNKNVRFIFKPGFPLYKLFDIYRDHFIHNRGETGYLGKKLYPERAYKREQKRLFGNTHFDYVIDFSGYSLFWAKYLLATESKLKICYMHNDLLSDSERKVKGKRPHRINLRGLFTVYHRFDKLVSVSKGTMELNRKNLIQYADYDKFDYILNSINPDKILRDHDSNIIDFGVKKSIKTENFKARALIKSGSKLEIFNSLPNSINFKKYTLKDDYAEKEIYIMRKAVYNNEILYKFSVDSRIIGWISHDLVQLLPDSVISEKKVNRLAELHRPRGNDIWSKPYKVEGIYKVSGSRDYKGVIFQVDREAKTQHSTYSRILINDTVIGWIDNAALRIVDDYTIDSVADNHTRNNVERKKAKILLDNYRKNQSIIDHAEDRTLHERDLTKMYGRISNIKGHSIWSKAYPNVGAEKIEKAAVYEGRVAKLIKMHRTRKGIYYLFSIDDHVIGWLDSRAFEIVKENLLIKESPVYRLAEISLRNTDNIWSRPYGLSGAKIVNIDRDSLEGTVVYVDKEATTLKGKYSHLVKDGKELGWLDSQALMVKKELGLIVNEQFIPYPLENDISFVNMGRLSPEKGQDNLIHAFKRFHENSPNSKLYILGSGPLEADLRNLIEQLNLNDAVYLLGQQEKPFDILKKCDCFILSSHYEGQPMVLLEAMTLGMNIIATDIVANRTVLEDGKYGLLVENSIDGLAYGMELMNRQDKKKVGAKFDGYMYNNKAMQSFYSQIGLKREDEQQLAK